MNFNNKNTKESNSIVLILENTGNLQKKIIKIDSEKTIKDLLNEIFVRFYNINIELCHLYFNGRDLRNYDKSIKIKNIFDDPSRI